MAISLNQLREAAARPQPREQLTKSLIEARASGIKTAFLCHSHKDIELVKGAVTLLSESGWRVYVDWQDASMPSKPNRQTASNIQTRIKQATYFLFLATSNSMASRWCPWEIGYADGVKNIDTIFIIETRDEAGNYYGSEYLELYRNIDVAKSGSLGAWHPHDREHGVLIRDL